MARIAIAVWDEDSEQPREIHLRCSEAFGKIFRIRQEVLADNGIVIYEWLVNKNEDYLLSLPELERQKAQKSEARTLMGHIGIIWYCIKCKKSSKWPECVPGRDKCEHELVIKDIQPWEEGK